MAEELDPNVESMLAGVSTEENFDDEDDGDVDLNSPNLSKKAFDPITVLFNETGHKFFDDPAYYKTALSGEDQSAQKLHMLLTKFLTAKDPKDRTVFRQQLTMSYWEFLRSIAVKMANANVPPAKKYLVRYGLVAPTLFAPEQKDFFSKVIDLNTTGEPVYYLDEWFHDIGIGTLTNSATDEGKPQKSKGGGNAAEQQRLQALNAKVSGKLQNAQNLLATKEHERAMLESELKSKIDFICDHVPLTVGGGNYTASYSDMQKSALNDIMERLRNLAKIDKEIDQYIKEVSEAVEETHDVQAKLAGLSNGEGEESGAPVTVNTAEILTEVDTVRQMAKMTVGRQGNHFPIYSKEYYHCLPKTTGFRENVLQLLAWVESLDPGAFVRIHKRNENRIVPYVLLVPTYGDTGFCWEPFDRYNRITSRGRIIVPMYPKSLQIAVLTATADLRWQVAKEKASYYWMEEGLTGQYYQWFDAEKLKGDVKDYFIQDYILWMTKESEGVQRLNKEVRGVFWRHMPFPQERKEILKTRSLVYQELCLKDANRAQSDGY